MPSRWIAATFVALISLTVFPADAARRRVALVNANPALESSARIALSPWELDVVPVEAISPGDSLPSALSRARDLAIVEHADAVVWISESAQKYVLWLYDVRTQQVVSRELTDPSPADMPGAAALALTLKTLFRSSTVTEEPKVAPPPSPPPIERPVPERAPVGGLRLEASGGARAAGSSEVELRLGLALGYWPRLFERHLGLILGVAAGPGVRVANADFTGRFTDLAIASSARLRVVLADHVTLQPSLGAALHLTVLDGSVSTPATPVHTTRIDPSLDAAVILAFEIGPRFELGVRAGESLLLRYQRYLVDDRVIVTLPPFALDLGIVASAAFN